MAVLHPVVNFIFKIQCLKKNQGNFHKSGFLFLLKTDLATLCSHSHLPRVLRLQAKYQPLLRAGSLWSGEVSP